MRKLVSNNGQKEAHDENRLGLVRDFSESYKRAVGRRRTNIVEIKGGNHRREVN